MTLSQTDIVELTTDTLLPAFLAERRRLDTIDLWYRWAHEDLVIPNGATREMKALLQLARTPWLGLVVTGVAQSMYVDGYRTPEAKDDAAPWMLFRRNGLQSRQSAIHRAMLAYGRSYGTSLPGKDPVTDEDTVVMRGYSPRNMLAFWGDPVVDEYPMYSIRGIAQGDHWLLEVLDGDAKYHLTTEVPSGSGEQVRYLDDQIHDAGVCPVVQFSNLLDLEGRTDGEVEPLIPLAKRIDKTAYDRLLIQHFNSYKVRWATGLSQPEDDEAANLRLRLRQDDLLINESPDGAFGTLPETTMDGILKAYETDIKTLAAASQTSVYALTGDMINVNAEGLAAARAEADAKLSERKMSAGGTWDKWLRLSSYLNGDDASANDFLAEVTWADTSTRSLAAAADALGKIATQLQVPPRALWTLIPGVSKTMADEWKQMAEEDDPIAQFSATLDRQAG